MRTTESSTSEFRHPADLFGLAALAHRPDHPAVLSVEWGHSGTATVSEPLATYFQTADQFDPEYRFAIDALLARVPRPARILDVGCGPGRFLRQFANLGYDVVGIDRSAECVELANRFAPGSAIRLDLWDMTTNRLGQFDVILLFGHNLGLGGDPPGVVRLLAHLAGMLTRGGRIALNSIDKSIEGSAMARNQVELARRAGLSPGQSSCVLHWHGYTSVRFHWIHASLPELRDWIADTRFRIEWTMHRPGHPAYWSGLLRVDPPGER